MSVSSLIRSTKFVPQITQSVKKIKPSTLDRKASKLVSESLCSFQNRTRNLLTVSSQSTDSLVSLSSRLSSTTLFDSLGSLSSGSLSSWIDFDLERDLRNKEDSVVKNNLFSDTIGHCLSSKLSAKIEEHKETGHRFIILESSSEKSLFLFFKKGDLSKKTCYSVCRDDTGEGISSEVDLRDMIHCFCFMQDNLETSWIKTSSEIGNRFKVNSKRVKYNLLLVHFDYQTVTVFSSTFFSLQGLSQFRGTKIDLAKDTKERIKDLLEKRSRKNESEKK